MTKKKIKQSAEADGFDDRLNNRYFIKGSSRHAARLAAVQLLYQFEQTQDPIKEIFSEFCRCVEGFSSKRLDKSFVEELVLQVYEKKESFDQAIFRHLSFQDSLEKMSILLRNILRLAVFEILDTDLPVPIVLNEYIEITKEFFDESSVSFVNGFLDSLSKERKEKEQQSLTS